jgi:protein phosphatase
MNDSAAEDFSLIVR